MYCTGHLAEAATAYYYATGKSKLLDVACRMVDLIDSKFGPEDGKLKGYPGHEELELALVKLYQATNNNRYLKLAKYFIDQRGQRPLYFDEEIKKRNYESHFAYLLPPYGMYSYGREYEQYHLPIREQRAFEGHAVRCMYMASGIADVARLTGDTELFDVCRTLYRNMVEKRMYLTGGIGSTHVGERFTSDYDLPNDTIYAETCASVGIIFFMQRMLLLEQNADYADTMERALYNTCIAGMSLDGKKFFYVNPLEIEPNIVKHNPDKSHVLPVRPEWFGCACCPPNLARMISALGSYIYTVNAKNLYVNLYIANEALLEIEEQKISLEIDTRYPKDGEISIVVKSDAEFGLNLRVPSWSRGKYQVTVNGETVAGELKKGYFLINRLWKSGDCIKLLIDMEPKRIYANPKVIADIGKVAVQRGPVVYCIEGADNGENLQQIYLPKNSTITEVNNPEKLTGIIELQVKALKLVNGGEDELYTSEPHYEFEDKELTFIPYYTWGNRGENEMTVWLHEKK